ncbi:MAG: Na+/H+ antiporter subunit E [Candidatus Omnitrophica bacterium]|nr:Na+/H+ antiporter subunit E [Candidatus Omnitrophota bacterium]
MKSKIVLFIVGFIVWMLLNWPPDIQHAFVGVFAAALVAFFMGNIFTHRPHNFLHIKRYMWFLCYIPAFLWECLKANIDIVFRLINPKLPINPGIIKVKTTLKSDTALTFLANLISLAPGTLCVDVNSGEGILYIHCLYLKPEGINEMTMPMVTKFEKILKRIFE